jgi:hypothetical protein
MSMLLLRRFPVVLAALALTACSAGAQKPALEAVLKSKQQRTESLEATLRVMDQHPEYVDELFAMTLRHPATLNRFLEDDARGLEDDALATVTAKHLAAHPAGLKRIMIKNLDEISSKPEAMNAVAEAMTERPEVAAMVVAQRQEAVRALFTELVRQVQKNAKARAAFVQAMKDNAEPLANIAAENPQVIAALAKALAGVEAARGKRSVEKALEK